MSETPHGRRAKRMALVVVGGAVVLTTVMAPAAMADEITFQDSNVVNAGAAAANSGGNVAIGNASTNVAATGQGAVGGLASNNATTSNTSNGTATITTGAATAAGSVAANDVDQSVAGARRRRPRRRRAGLRRHQRRCGGLQHRGQPRRRQRLHQHRGHRPGCGGPRRLQHGRHVQHLQRHRQHHHRCGDGAGHRVGDRRRPADRNRRATDGLAVLVQDADVINFGLAFANSGGNAALGNVSTNIAATGQGALGFLASNNATTGNTPTARRPSPPVWPTPSATRPTTPCRRASPARTTASWRSCSRTQMRSTSAPPVRTAGQRRHRQPVVQREPDRSGPRRLIASNVSNALNNSDGIGGITTGAATGHGNEAVNDITQNS